MQCPNCGNTFKTTCSLNKHIRTAKYCQLRKTARDVNENLERFKKESETKEKEAQRTQKEDEERIVALKIRLAEERRHEREMDNEAKRMEMDNEAKRMEHELLMSQARVQEMKVKMEMMKLQAELGLIDEIVG